MAISGYDKKTLGKAAPGVVLKKEEAAKTDPEPKKYDGGFGELERAYTLAINQLAHGAVESALDSLKFIDDALAKESKFVYFADLTSVAAAANKYSPSFWADLEIWRPAGVYVSLDRLDLFYNADLVTTGEAFDLQQSYASLLAKHKLAGFTFDVPDVKIKDEYVWDRNNISVLKASNAVELYKKLLPTLNQEKGTKMENQNINNQETQQQQQQQEEEKVVEATTASTTNTGAANEAAKTDTAPAVTDTFLGLETETWKKIGWGTAAVGVVAAVGYGAYAFFSEDGGTVNDGTSGAPCF